MRSTICVLAMATLIPPTSIPAATSSPSINGIFVGTSGEMGAGDVPSGRTIGLQFHAFSVRRFKVDKSRLAIELTCRHFCEPGSRYTLGTQSSDFVISNEVSDPSDPRTQANVNVPIPTSVLPGLYAIALVASGNIATELNGDPQTLPSTLYNNLVFVPPIPGRFGIDNHLASIRKEYIGKTVQGFGPLQLDCVDPQAAEKERVRKAAIEKFRATKRVNGHINSLSINIPDKPNDFDSVGNEPSLVVTSIERPLGPPKSWSIGGTAGVRYNRENAYLAIEPLLVNFKVTPLKCFRPHAWFSDSWEVRHVLWIHRPIGLLDTTPIVNGMSKLAVAHILGSRQSTRRLKK